MWALALVILVLTVPVDALALSYAARCKRMAWRASRAARQASTSALEASYSSRLAVCDAERAMRLLNAARTRAAEFADADVAEQLAAPLTVLPAPIYAVPDEPEAPGGPA